jgi:serum/glucocorticoid-regulated kinase 2
MVEALTKEFDYLKFVEDSSIPPLINNEKILFSDKIYKVNKWGFSQERNLVITEKAVYNFKKKTMKRRIDTASIRGITITKVTEEFVIHGNDEEYDYHFFSSKRKKIIEFVSRTFFEITKREFRLCELDLKTLKSVVTNKKEKKKDQNFSRMPNTNIIPVCIYLYGTKNDLNVNKKTSTVVRHNNTLFSKRKEITDVCLEDFKILKVLGRGSVAKVCLVEYIKTKEIYAMKSIKKDIIIDQEQIENTLLEKKILESLEHPFLVGLIFAFQTEERIYFVMPFLRGGDLFHQLKQSKIFDEEK